MKRQTFWNLAGLLVMGSLCMTACGPDYPACDDDDDCKDKEFCVNNRCQLCRDDKDCGPGKQCAQGRCDPIPGFCRSKNDCGPGESCVGNRCQGGDDLDRAGQGTADDATAGGCTIEPVYFEFDSSTIAPASRVQIETNLECARKKSFTGLHLTGHTDPRGTEEYNLALGDRRAQSVRGVVTSLGMATAKVTASSVGEEMAQGTEESGWSKDRRVEFQAR